MAGTKAQTHGGQPLGRSLFASLMLQVANYIFPLIQLPYLARILHVEGIGAFVFISNVIAYCVVVIDWGFSLGATREVARNRMNREALRPIYWTTLTARLLMLIVAVPMLLVFALLPVGRSFEGAIVIGTVALVAASLTPEWYFQGLERIAMLTGVTITARTLSILSVFIFVHSRADLWKLILITGLTPLFAALASLWVGRSLLPRGPAALNVRAGFGQVVEYRYFFLTRAAVMLYTMSAPVVLGFVAGTAAVGIYGGADRLSRAVLAMLNQLSSVFYPRINALLANDPASAVHTLRRLGGAQILVTTLMSLGIFVLSGPVILTLLGHEFAPSVPVLRWLAALPMLVGFNIILTIQIMIPLRMERETFLISLASAALFLSLTLLLGRTNGAVGAAQALVATEAMVSVLATATLRARRPDFFRELIGR